MAEQYNSSLISETVSPFQRTVHSAKFIRNDLSQKMRSSLIAEAQELRPDGKAIYEQVDKLEMHDGDKRRLSSGIDGQLKAFGEGFAKNPFYAFSKQGRGQVSSVSSLINNGANAGLVQRKAQDDEALAKASENNTLGNLQIRDGKIKVIRKQDGRSNWININAFNEDKGSYIPLTVQEDYQNTARVGADASIPFSSSMSSHSDILDKVEGILNNVGKTKDTRFATRGDILETITNSNNISQMSQAIAYLQEAGLTNEDINTLVSKEYQANPNQSYEQAKMNALGSIANLGGSQIDNETTRSRSVNPQVKANTARAAANGKAGNPTATLSQADIIFRDINASTDFWSFKSTRGSLTGEGEDVLTGIDFVSQAIPIPTNILQSPVTEIATTDEFNKYKSSMVSDNAPMKKIWREGANKGTLKMIVQTNEGDNYEQGQFVNMPKDVLNKAFIYDEGDSGPKVINYVRNTKNNQMLSISQAKELNEMMKSNDPTVFTKYKDYLVEVKDDNGKLMGRRVNNKPTMSVTIGVKTEGDGSVSSETESILDEAGMLSTDSKNGEGAVEDDVRDFVNKYTKFGGGSSFGTDDVTLMTVMIPIEDYNSFAISYGATVKEANNSLMSFSEYDVTSGQLIPEAYSGGNNQMVNQTKKNKYDKYSD